MTNDVNSKCAIADPKAAKKDWLDRLSRLVADIEGWARELDWSTKQIEKKIRDSQLGTYQAPALLLQRETTRCLLEPITSRAPDVEGLVDLYLLPAYDDIASFRYSDGEWRLYYQFPQSPPVVDPLLGGPLPYSKESLQQVLDSMTKNVE